MGRLKAILLLPVTRKITLALFLLFLAKVNNKLGLGISQEDMQMFAYAIYAVIVGIAIEDLGRHIANGKNGNGVANGGAIKNSEMKGTGADNKYVNEDGSVNFGTFKKIAPFLMLPFLWLGSGCIEVHQKDQTTIAHVERTIEDREHDYNFLLSYANATTKTAELQWFVNGMRGLHESELDRLKSWRAYENAKSDTPGR